MFKIGDKVIVVNAESVGGYYKNGDIGVVSKIDSKLYGYVTRNDGVEMNVYWREVELYKQPVVFQAGDCVKFTESSLASGMIDAKEDDVFTVKESYKRVVTLEELQGCYHVTHFEHVQEEAMNNTEEQEIKWEGSQIDWQVGQEVFCLLRGKGVVHQIYNTGVDWSEGVDVYFRNHGVIRFKFDGTIGTGFNRSLFFSEPRIEAEKFPPKKPFVPVFKQGETIVAKKKDGKNTVVFYVDKETEISVESTGYGYPKTLYNFYKISEEVKFS